MAAKKKTKKTGTPGKKKKVAARTVARKTSTGKTTKKKTTKKVAKKPATKAPAKKKTTPKKAAAMKTPAKKTVAKKKTSSKKTPTKKTPAKKTAAATTKKVVGKAEAAGSKKKKKKRTGRRTLGARSVAEAASASTADAEGYVYINGRRVRMISTAGQENVARKNRLAKKAAAAEEIKAPEIKLAKTKLTTKELRHYRTVLLQKRGELMGDVSAMETAALKSHGGNLSNLPIHMADVGSDTYDQDFMLSLAETERQRLHEIDAALMRIMDKTYGVCQMTGDDIPKARLDAKPWAKYTIEAARKVEGQWRA